jgi:hypothetical protein
MSDGFLERTKYKIVRHFANGLRQTIRKGLTLEAARAYCRDPETSSRTARSAKARRLTASRGSWF